VVSEGFGFYVRELLAAAGLGHLPWAANRMCFEPGDQVRAEFPFHDPDCPRCGNCKARHVRDWRSRGFRTVMVGDGLSDRCGARAADAVVASGALLAWCREAGVAARAFEDFHDVATVARALHGVGAA
jgi:2-hydroxy-3-keto-5-methylthiopentenyl-1-phosphate phosphatase